MNKKYLTVPAILAAICVSSGALIGGVHALTSWYMETHKKEGAPEEIEALYNDGSTFKEVADFQPYDVIGSAYKVKITAVYEVIRGGSKVGYAYLVNGGKPVNTETVIAVSFEGDVNEQTKASLQPKAINLVVAGDSGYEAKPEAYVASLKAGESLTEVWTGGTSKSGQSVHDALIAAREDYVARWNGQSSGGETDETKVYLKKVVANLKSYAVDETFTPIVEAWDEKDNGINIDVIYNVTTEDDVVIPVYHSKSYAYVIDEEGYSYVEMLTSWTQEITAETAIEDVNFAAYTVVKQNMSFSQWSDDYLPGLSNGSKDIDNDADTVVGATCAAKAIQKTFLLERQHYYDAHKAN